MTATMNRRWCLGFTLSSMAAMAPASARADGPDSPAPQAPEPTPPDATPPTRPDPTAADPTLGDATPVEADTTPPSDESDHLLALLCGGYSIQNLYGTAITGWDLSGALGSQRHDFAGGAQFEFVRAWTPEGLQVTCVSIGPYIAQRMDRLQVAGGVRVGTFDMSRITNTSSLLSTSAGVFVRVTYDLAMFAKDNRNAIYVMGKASVDSVNATLWAAGA